MVAEKESQNHQLQRVPKESYPNGVLSICWDLLYNLHKNICSCRQNPKPSRQKLHLQSSGRQSKVLPLDRRFSCTTSTQLKLTTYPLSFAKNRFSTGQAVHNLGQHSFIFDHFVIIGSPWSFFCVQRISLPSMDSKKLFWGIALHIHLCLQESNLSKTWPATLQHAAGPKFNRVFF